MTVENFPKAKKLVLSLPAYHPARALLDCDIFMEELELFLSLEGIPGFQEKLDHLGKGPFTLKNLEKGKGGATDWASFRGELRAVWLLTRAFGMHVLGFEQASPRCRKGNETCDLKVRAGNEGLFVEVKTNCREEDQKVPPALEQALLQLGTELGYRLVPKLRQRKYKGSTLEEDLAEIRKHDADFKLQKITGAQGQNSTPEPFVVNGRFEVHFCEQSENEDWAEYLDEASLEDIARYVAGKPPGVGRDGKPKSPMIEQAQEKGADYLMCRIPNVPGEFSLADVVNKCFKGAQPVSEKTFCSPDPILGDLRGVIFFPRDPMQRTAVCVRKRGSLALSGVPTQASAKAIP